MKVCATMTFEVNVPEGQSPEEFVAYAAAWIQEDPAGFLLARPLLIERLPTTVCIEVLQPDAHSKCGHTVYGNGHCAEMTCDNHYSKH